MYAPWKLLLATGSRPEHMAPPRLAAEQVVCGPHFPDAKSADGRWTTIRTPSGLFDLAAVVEHLPSDQRPDVVVCLVDGASWMCVPRNLARIEATRVLLIADTHHQSTPLRGMVQYIRTEPFDRLVMLYGRHHIPLLREAGVANLFWFPGLTFPFSDAEVRLARKQCERFTRIGFVGQSGGDHPRRQRLFQAIRSAGLDFQASALPQSKGLAHYGASLVGFNASLILSCVQ